MNVLDSIDPTELSVLSNVFAISIAKDRSSDEINVLGNFIVAVGGILLTIAAQQQSLESMQNKKTQIKDLKKQIKQLEKSL